MIYTVTFNPALDYIMGMEKFVPGVTNRSLCEQYFPGGKGLNVSLALDHFGIENTALGFIAGFTGAEIERRFEALGGKSDFICLDKGISRVNVKIKAEEETELNASGPEIDGAALRLLMEKINMLTKEDMLILSGNVQSGVTGSVYGNIMDMLSGRETPVVVDAEKELLLNALQYRPFLIKPNHHELGEIFGVTLETRESVIPYAKKLQKKGAKNVLVSLAGEGAVLITETGRTLMCQAPNGVVRNSVGAGDCMVAGFVAGWCERHDYLHALRMGVAAGSAGAFSDGLAEREKTEQLYAALTFL